MRRAAFHNRHAAAVVVLRVGVVVEGRGVRATASLDRPDSENTPSPSKSIVTRMSELGTPSSKICAFTVPEMEPAVLTCMNNTRLSSPAVAFDASPVTNQDAPDTEFDNSDVAPSSRRRRNALVRVLHKGRV